MDYTINGKVFHSVDSLTRITTKDSFTDRENKLGNGAGAWEWHIGSKNDAAKYAFFGGPGFNVKYPDLPVTGRESYLHYHRTNIFKN